MLSYNELRPGTIFLLDGQPCKVLEYEFLRMQQRKPVAQLKVKNLLTGRISNYTAHQNESFREAEIETLAVIYLYGHRGEYWFQDPTDPKNRFSLPAKALGEAVKYLKPRTEVRALKFGGKIVSIELPVKIDLKVVEAPPGLRGDTAQGGSKTVKLETGVEVSAPLFINEGDVIRVNTETGEYVERVEKA